MFDFISLYFADRYMPLSNKRKRHKLARLERMSELVEKLFKFCLAFCLILCNAWNINKIMNGPEIYGIIDIFIESLIYPAVILLLCHHIKQNKFGLILVMGAAFLAMLWHTPTYGLMLGWSIVFVIVRFQISGMQKLVGYPEFHDDLRGKRKDDMMTEDQRYAAFQQEVKKSNRIIWHEEEQERTAEDILSGKVGIDEYYGVHKCENPGVMDELVIPEDLDLEDSECYKK